MSRISRPVKPVTKFHIVRQKVRAALGRIGQIIDRRPLTSFVALMAVIVGLIVAGNFLRKPPAPDATEESVPKQISVYGIGAAPKIRLTGRVEKSGIVQIVAQVPGIVQSVNVTEGTKVSKGKWLVRLSNNYQGGSTASVSRSIAYKSYQFSKDNYDAQKEIIGKRREITEKSETMASDLRDIASKSIDETKSLISLNEEILDGVDAQIDYLESTNVGGANDADIAAAKQGKSAVLGGLNSLKNALRNTEYQASGDQEPADLARLQKDLTMKGLEIEEKSLDLNRDIAKLNLQLAAIGESMMNPATPISGVVERVFVRQGDNVNPGNPLLTIKGNSTSARVILAVPGEVARQASRLEPSRITLRGKTIELTPHYISTEATDGSLFNILYEIPDEFVELLDDTLSVAVELPVGTQMTSGIIPFVPLDAIFQTQDSSYVYTASSSAEGTVAFIKNVELGTVYGSYVEVRSGLETGDQVITTRGVVEGDTVQIK